MELNTILYLSILIFSGLIFGKLAKLVKLPNVTGYLVAGLLVGPSVLGVIPETALSGFDIISEVALGFIAFSIGSEFKLSYFKKVGIAPVIIAILEAMLAVVAVVIGLLIAGFDLSFSLVLGSIAAATAPAATIMVIKQYKAKGPLTETLMSVVALDDAVALMAFGFAVTAAKAMNSTGDTNLVMSILSPFIEIFGSVLLGFALGVLFMLPLKFFRSSSNRLIITIGMVFLATGLSNLLGLSALLCCMSMGAMLVNVSNSSSELMKLSDNITPPIFLLFFVVSGAELNLGVIPSIGLVGVLYILLRVVGKISGAWLGAKLTKAPKEVCKYLGYTLVPQAGVAIGLTLVAQTVVPEYADTIRAVVLCGTLVYELVGPMVSKMALQKAGEIQKGL